MDFEAVGSALCVLRKQFLFLRLFPQHHDSGRDKFSKLGLWSGSGDRLAPGSRGLFWARLQGSF